MVTLKLRDGLWMRKPFSSGQQLGVICPAGSLKTRSNGNPINSGLLGQMVLVLEQKSS